MPSRDVLTPLTHCCLCVCLWVCWPISRFGLSPNLTIMGGRNRSIFKAVVVLLGVLTVFHSHLFMTPSSLIQPVSAAAALRVTDDASPITFGASADANLYRSSTGPSLRTDSSLLISGMLRASNLVSVATTVTVCASGGGCQFTSLATAVNYARSLYLAAPLTISVAAGTYLEPNIGFYGFTHPNMITIRGVPANPASCVLQQTQPGNFISFSGRGTDGITFSGFRIVALNQDGIPLVLAFTHVFVPGSGGAATLIIQGGVYCILAQFHAMLIASTALTCTGNSYGVNFQYGSTLFCNGCRFTGAGVAGSWSVYSHINSYVHVGSSVITTGYTYGQACSPFSMVIAAGTTFGTTPIAQTGCTGQYA